MKGLAEKSQIKMCIDRFIIIIIYEYIYIISLDGLIVVMSLGNL